MYGQMSQQQQLQMQLMQWFQAVDADRSGLIEADELVRCLSQGGHKFSSSTSETLIRMFDQQNKGSVNFQEFFALYQFIMSMKQSFMQVDQDNSGAIDLNELNVALQSTGFQFPPQVVQTLCQKFGSQGQVLFDHWIALCAFLGHARSLFQMLDSQRSGKIVLDLNSFINVTATLH